ncbi:hypothetical protein BQ9231_00388 [Cedratvirus lausannensis]|uniref:Uncharacterized protein n=1 Tax=Cedratvirus lausannensis TaxID=2023205 RepID=A0A285PXB1_9VIRU|nr:hypothetical protein BQ9231_00388 [Cedratvirus lausannensis]
MSVTSLLELSFRKLFPEDALQLVTMGIDLPWRLACEGEFFDFGLQRGLSERERFVELLSYKVFTDLACPPLYEQDTLQLEKFRGEEELDHLPRSFQHNVAFYRNNFALGWRTFPFKSIVHHFLPWAGVDELLKDPILLNSFNANANYASFLSLYKPVHYLLSQCELVDLLSEGLPGKDLCRVLELKIIYDREGKEARDLLLSLCDSDGYLPQKVNQALLVHGQGVLDRKSISDMSALAFSCRYNFLRKIPQNISRIDLFLNAFEGWMHHRRLEDFYYTTRLLLTDKIGREDTIKLCQFSRSLPVDIVNYILGLVTEKTFFLKGILRNNKGYLGTIRFCEIKLQEMEAETPTLPPMV